MKKILVGLLLTTFGLVGCGEKDNNKVLTMSIWEGTGDAYLMETNSLADAYK